MNTLQTQRTEKIKQLLFDLNDCLKMSVERAVEIGKELNAQKEEMQHGEFLPWLEKNFQLSERNAYRYMKLYQHNSKIAKMANLQEAYEQIESIEKQERRKQEAEDNRLINQRINTGQKPEGWGRRHDRIYKQRIDEGAYQERKQKAFNEQAQKSQAIKDRVDNIKAKFEESNKNFNTAQKFLNNLIDQEKTKEETRKKLRISNNNEIIDQDIWFESFRDYADQFENPNRRLELIQNFMKFLKGMAIECQREIKAS